MKVKKNDEVKIMRGKDAGKSGKVMRVFAKEEKVLVENINQFKRHKKARMQGQRSEIITITKPVELANVQLICPQCKKVTRVGFRVTKGTKERMCRQCGKAV